MGCPLPVLRFLAREHRHAPFMGPVLTLGRQCVYATLDDVRDMLRAEGIEPRALPQGMSHGTNIPSWRHGPEARFTSDHAFFAALAGIETQALDNSDYEAAEIVWDLNQPAPAELERRFGLIFDGGTLEHVFDTRVALQNLCRMVKPGGRIIHTNPASNYLAHGFYQFSPTLYYDFYGANGFRDLRCFIAEQPPWTTTGRHWRLWEWDPRRPYSHVRSNRLLMVFFCAERGADSTFDKLPQQGEYLTAGNAGRTGAAEPEPGSMRRLAAKLPPRLLIALRRLRGRDLNSEPWGLKYLGRL